MEQIYKIANLIQVNNEDEASAIAGYTELLHEVFVSDLSSTEKEKCFETIKEIISDELNHQKKLQELYTMLTDIVPNKEWVCYITKN